ncbi:Hypothetical protein PHPALM_17208 [Phytophthora palmivora]|uniref:Uncharacterized protein n=1 Tax=Phytophthora palmivora TaxID=4796 RepID=A0A2P4XMW2_9STRA|nr:Hypothetical protein PHPALM_17208 [Phytophthora palmivora]
MAVVVRNIFGKPGCTGEPIVESGAPRDYSDNEDGVDEDDERGEEYGAGSDDEYSDTLSQARNEAKANGKAHSQSGRLS